MRQRSLGSADVANEFVILQSGRENYVFDVDQQSTGLTRNTVRVILTGNRNGFAGGTVLRGETHSGALSGLSGLSELRTIAAADAPLPFYAAFDGPAAYALPASRPGASVLQVGSANRADLNVTGDDNSFQIDQNSRSALGAQTTNLTNAVAWTVSGSSNYLYALQVGAGNSATNVVVGQQNTLAVYQASEAGAGQSGYGNIVEWRQGTGFGDIQNSAELVQLGINNTLTGAQLGSLNVVHSLQRGAGNEVYAMQIGSGQLANVAQAGVGNMTNVQQSTFAPAPGTSALRR
ncbi:hypothetical protein [Methylorubrum sp. GM97]|uniref:hypothetical protein n=1 Tax=Methylorubrum sp. GM97 TaxID=2938232 RepID=UPI00218AACDA|nr:hypothetical protein [Methylorubrum sp. GM97]BDL41803.1 hypothetical protein MSPGM_43930 [Methylorubrum sp. GM97]